VAFGHWRNCLGGSSPPMVQRVPHCGLCWGCWFWWC
jgi:hypothetical protein